MSKASPAPSPTNGIFIRTPTRVSHLVVLIATVPPGPLVQTGETLFFQNDFEDVVQIFFEPESPVSREATQRSEQRISARQVDRSPPVPVAWAGQQLGDSPRNPAFPAEAVLNALKSTRVPIIHIGGDHDIALPAANWHAFSGRLPTLHVLTLPSTGHVPPSPVSGAVRRLSRLFRVDIGLRSGQSQRSGTRSNLRKALLHIEKNRHYACNTRPLRLDPLQ